MIRKRSTKEFMQHAVRLVTEHGYTQAEAGRNLGITANMLELAGRAITPLSDDDSGVGTRLMARELTQRGHRMGRYPARGLMREAGVRVRYRRRYRVTTESCHRHPVFPNRLQRCFHVAAPNRVWASDISVPQQAA